MDLGIADHVAIVTGGGAGIETPQAGGVDVAAKARKLFEFCKIGFLYLSPSFHGGSIA